MRRKCSFWFWDSRRNNSWRHWIYVNSPEYREGEAVKRGFGEYVFEEKEIMFKWNEAVLEK